MKKAKSVKSATAGQSRSDKGVEVNTSIWSLGAQVPVLVRKCEGRMSVCAESSDSNTKQAPSLARNNILHYQIWMALLLCTLFDNLCVKGCCGRPRRWPHGCRETTGTGHMSWYDLPSPSPPTVTTHDRLHHMSHLSWLGDGF